MMTFFAGLVFGFILTWVVILFLEAVDWNHYDE